MNAAARRRLLVINPNTSASVTALLQHHATLAAGDAVQVDTMTARFGAPYIADEAGYAVAAHATLDAWAAALANGPAPDAVLIGCFGDPGLFALREASRAPVTGLAEAALREAAAAGRYAIVTGGERWRPMLLRLARDLGLDAALAAIHTVAPSGAQLAAHPEGARQLLAVACREAAALPGVQRVVLGGAGLAGIAARLQAEVPVPVIDSVQAGVRHALALPPGTGRATDGFDFAWSGVSPELSGLGRR